MAEAFRDEPYIRKLQALGFNLGRRDEDGQYIELGSAIRQFQRMHSAYGLGPMTVTGSANEDTKKAIDRIHATQDLRERFYENRILRQGHADGEVTEFQRRLQAMGYWLGPVDGNFDGNFADAVKMFQRDHRMEPDGVIGPAFRKEIDGRHRHNHRFRQAAAEVDPAILHEATRVAAVSMDMNREGMQAAVQTLQGDRKLTGALANLGDIPIESDDRVAAGHASGRQPGTGRPERLA